MDSGKDSQVRGSRRTWTKMEEEAFLSVLEDCVANGGRCENGSFKSGTMFQMEKALQEICPNSGLKFNPHIDSKMRKWKKDYGIIYDMMNTSGFAWNDVKKCIEVDSDDAWQSYVKNNKDAEGWRGKPYPIFDRLAYIFGKDRATGKGAEGPGDMAQAVNEEEENMNDRDIEESSPISVPNRSTAISSRSRKRNKSSDITEDATMKSFENMFQKSIEQLNCITEKLVN